MRIVSVPLRGKGRDQPTGTKGQGLSNPPSFPSPCGEKVGINSDDGGTDIIFYDLEFPSPCGEKVGINTSYQMR